MAMIQGIDGGALINMFRQGREDRYQTDQRKLLMAQEQAKAERQKQITGLTAQILGPQQSGGVTGNYAPSNPQQPSLDTPGAAMPALPTQQPIPSQAAPGQAPTQINQDALNKLIIFDPETGGKIAEAFGKMSDREIKQHRAKNDAMGSGAAALQQYPEGSPERQQAFQSIIAPHLLASGWTQDEIAHVDLSNHGLVAYQAIARDTDKIIDQTLARDEFNAGKTVAVQPGGMVATVRPTYGPDGQVTGNTASTLIQPYQAANTPPAAPVTKVLGGKTYYQTQDGKWHDEPPGGQPGGTAPFSGKPASNGTEIVRQLFPNAQITSGFRPAGTKLAGGKTHDNSWHTQSHGAVDVAPIPGMTFEQYVNKFRAAGYPIIEQRDEAINPSKWSTGPHWHVVLGAR